MSLLEVVAMHAADAERAEQGGADRIALLGSLADDGRAPEPETVAHVRRVTSIVVRPLLRLRPGFSTDGGEFTRLKGLISSYLEVGADGVIVGFLNGMNQVDDEVVGELLGDAAVPYTFDRAIDHCLDQPRAWRAVRELPGALTHVLTAGSVRDVEHGLSDLLARAKSDPALAKLIMAGGDLKAEHVPWLIRAGVRAFQIDVAARPGGTFKAYVDADLVRSWRELIDDETAAERGRHAAQG